jgi:serine/threonine-protein kinase
LSGKTVFTGKTPIEVILKHVNDEPVPLRSLELGIPEALDAAILSCLAKDPKRRPPSAEALDQMLEALTFEQPWTRVRARESWRESR